MGQTNRVFLDLSLQSAVRHWATYQPACAAIISEYETLTYSDLHKMICAQRQRIHNLCLERQTPVGILINSKPDFLAAVCALLCEGHIPVFLNLCLEPSILRKSILDAGCQALICDSKTTCPCETASPTIKCIHMSSADPAKPMRHAEVADRYADDTWGILYSSGTTGIPKGIVRSDLSVLTELIGWCFELPITRASTIFIARPIYYTGGLVLSAATLLVGGTILLPQEYSVSTYAYLASQHPVDVAFLIPEQVRELLNAYPGLESNLPRPTAILTMGASIQPSIKQQVIDLLADQYVESWGNTEGLGTITAAEDIHLRPTSIGRPFVSDKMWIVDDDGNRLGSGEIGRLAGRADSTLTEYRHRNDLNRRFIHGRVVMSEDLGYIDREHYFHLVGRVSERILIRGMPVFAADIEDSARVVPGVSDIAVAGIPDETGADTVVALVVPSSEGTDTTALFRGDK